MEKCFLMGHSDTPNEVLPYLSAEIERHITELGVTEFLVGSMAALTLWRRKLWQTRKSATRRWRLRCCLPTIPKNGRLNCRMVLTGHSIRSTWRKSPNVWLSSGRTDMRRTTATSLLLMPGSQGAIHASWWSMPRAASGAG